MERVSAGRRGAYAGASEATRAAARRAAHARAAPQRSCGLARPSGGPGTDRALSADTAEIPKALRSDLHTRTAVWRPSAIVVRESLRRHASPETFPSDAALHHACDLLRRETAPGAADVPFGGETRGNGAQRQARSSRARAIVACSRSSTTSLTPSASSAKPKGTDPMRAPRARLAASAAHVRDRIKPCSYLGCAVDHRADERVGRRIAVALTADTHDAGGFERHGGLHAAREHDVTGDPVASCDDEYVRGVLAQGRERRTQRGPCGDGRDAAHAVIGVPHGHPDALADRPGLDGGALGLSRETLFVLRRAQVGDCDARTSGGGALAHATRRTEHGGGTRHAAGGGCRPEAPRSPRDRCSLIGRDQEVCRRRRGAGRRTARSSPPRAFAPSGTAPG
jgi:hypothetical protein